MRHLPACRHSYFLSQMLAFDPGPRKAWREKIPQRSEDDFFPANQPHGGRLAREKRNPVSLLRKNGKTFSCQRKMQTLRPAFLLSILYLPRPSGHGAVGLYPYSTSFSLEPHRRNISSVTSSASWDTSFRNVSCTDFPCSTSSSCASQPEVRDGSAIFMPRTVS